MKIHERCSSIDGFIDLFFLIRRESFRSHYRFTFTQLYFPGSLKKSLCWQSQEKNTNECWRVLVYKSCVCVCLCVSTSQVTNLVLKFLFIEVLYRGDQSLRKDQRYLSGTCRSSCMTLAAVGFLRTSTLGLTWSRCWWNRRSEGVGF